MKIKPVQKQTRAGQRTRFKAIVVIGDSEGHVGLGIKTSKEVATAIRAAIIIAKLSVVPIRRGYWGTNLGEPHSLPTKESGKCGSVTVRLIPAPRGTGLVASPAVKRLLQLAGVQDIYTASSGSTKTLDVTIGRLRQKLESVGVQEKVVAVRGVGFRLEGSPSDS